jgi:hypothetical protein
MKTLPNVTLELLATTTLINVQSKVWARDNLAYLNSGNRLLGTSTKLEKGKDKFSSYVLYLQPADKVAQHTLCPMAETAGCKAPCLITSGRLGMKGAQAAATRRTILMLLQPVYFTDKLLSEIDAAERKALKTGIPALFRLNGTSDIPWTKIIDARPDSMFYDYTKNVSILRHAARRANYDATYSGSMYSDRSRSDLRLAVLRGDRVAMAFNTKNIGSDTLTTGAHYSFDTTDLRHKDPKGIVGSLTSKGSSKATRAAVDLQANSFFVTSANLSDFRDLIANDSYNVANTRGL